MNSHDYQHLNLSRSNFVRILEPRVKSNPNDSPEHKTPRSLKDRSTRQPQVDESDYLQKGGSVRKNQGLDFDSSTKKHQEDYQGISYNESRKRIAGQIKNSQDRCVYASPPKADPPLPPRDQLSPGGRSLLPNRA
ncbi:hypothetical protein C922_05724 [Plasmodium inui San Antonio 1]|uniref:Uncharacterized protein n=1 Tax=Plasmodium inui San Antonio 1 TaxID=1237626 RepID=W7A479_9APIC|nr:hypothetical protein C922_05724 [Plasmodium inui San Antonio 1]EUD63894.1 hypothetical protein C922_05724 [Plasmodium inui San Antonio 1]